MKISCDIIRDILPLYAEDMVSPATHDFVDEHLSECESCTQELQKLKEKSNVPMDADVTTIQRIGKHIKRKQILLALCVLFTAASVLWSGIVFLCCAPVYLPCDQVIEKLELAEDGGLVIYQKNADVYYQRSFEEIKGDKIAWSETTRYDLLKRKLKGTTPQILTSVSYEFINNVTGSRFCFFAPTPGDYAPSFLKEKYTQAEHDYDLWYVNPDGTYERIWNGGDGELPIEEIQNYYPERNTKTYGYWCLGLLAMAAASFTGFCFLKNRKLKEVLFFVGTLMAAMALYLILITGGDFRNIPLFDVEKWINNLPLTLLLLIPTAILWRRLYLLNHPAK